MNIPMFYPGGASQIDLFLMAFITVLIVGTIGYTLGKMAFRLYISLLERKKVPLFRSKDAFETYLSDFTPEDFYEEEQDWFEISPDFEDHL